MTTGIDLNREQILAALRELEKAFRAKGVTSLAIFGSRSRGDHRPDSDLDILIDVDPSRVRPLFIAFDVQKLIQDATGLETQATLRSEVKQHIAQRMADDIIKVF